MAAEHAPYGPHSGYEPPRSVGVAEYLRLAEALDGLYEYHEGLMYPRAYPPGSLRAMAGGTRAHARLIARIVAALDTHLRGRPCDVYPSEMRLRVAEDAYFYPDAFVSCDEDAAPGRIEERDAVLVVEVRSASTSEFERGDKFLAYQQLPGTREYLLLDNRRVQATLFRLGEHGQWRHLTVTGAAELRLDSVRLALPLATLYEGIPLDGTPTS